MDSPTTAGDTTTASIAHRLDGTHLEAANVGQAIAAASYGGQNFIQLTLSFAGDPARELVVLRRVEDSYINANQLFEVLVAFDLLSSAQVDNFIADDIVNNPQYRGDGVNQYNDMRSDSTPEAVRGVWISYDKAVALAIKFDVYELVKQVFLIDVHEFDKLPHPGKRVADSEGSASASPTKRLKTDPDANGHSEAAASRREHQRMMARLVEQNTNAPYAASPKNVTNDELAAEVKATFGDVFKADQQRTLSEDEVRSRFAQVLARYPAGEVVDVALDPKGQTALHFAATLASANLVAAFVNLGLNSPVRGNMAGETPLVSAIQVTNSMERNNFGQLVSQWLWPDLWLFDRKRQTILHHLAMHSAKRDLTKYYTTKIVEYVAQDDKRLHQMLALVNCQDDDNGDTALHWAVEQESKWLVRLLLLMRADPNLANNKGVKPSDFELVQSVVAAPEPPQEYVFDLVATAIELLDQRLAANADIAEVEEPVEVPKKVDEDEDDEPGQASAKIFQSIQDLLTNTNVEYEVILNAKREQIATLNQSLHDATIVTANNRFMLKSLCDRLAELDNLKLQMANLTDKLQLLDSDAKDLPELEGSVDDPYIIPELHSRLVKGEPVDDISPGSLSLQPTPILKARIAAYKQVNARMDAELQSLMDYSELTSKFKKVVSICTGVAISEVDDLLDGLLEAVEGQQ
ncbi:hypothetical protein DICA3_E02784 [Diutina catenulata]